MGRGNQSGYALLVFVLALMSMGGIVAASFTQQVRVDVAEQKHLHNQRVLEEAKQALLYYAYNYAQISDGAQGPGRLPCVDVDNDGNSDTGIGDCIAVGRLPWAEPALALPDLRDADGQRLWYAVSQNFVAGGAIVNTVNGDADGNITMRDRSGNIVVDGSVAAAVDGQARGIAAVIIAPGAPVELNNGNIQDRLPVDDDPFDTVPDDDPGVVDADRYLDEFFAIENNHTFVQGGVDGFIGGPIDDRNADTVRVNDQIIVITAQEVVDHAARAVLEAYRQALLDFDQRQDVFAAGDHYPWLYDYSVYNYGQAPTVNDYELDEYPADPVFANEPLGRAGRIPSIFANYFTEVDSRPIESRIRYDLQMAFAPTVEFNQLSGVCPEDRNLPPCTNGLITFSGTQWPISQTSLDPLTNVRFVDVEPDAGGLTNHAQLAATVVSAEINNFNNTLWFWDEFPVGDGFTQCPGVTDDESDCYRDEFGVPFAQNPDGNETTSQVLRITLNANYNVNAGDNIAYNLDFDTPVVPTIEAVSGAGNHSRVSGSVNGANVGAIPIAVTASYDFDDELINSISWQASGTLVGTDLVRNGNLTLTLRHYPQLPDWAFDEGWHDGIMMAYAADYLPGAAAGPCTPGTDCLTVNNYQGADDDKAAVLVLASEHDWADEVIPDNLSDNLDTVFDFENATPLDDIFDASPRPGNNDRVLVMGVWP